jgi:hypothetical protein
LQQNLQQPFPFFFDQQQEDEEEDGINWQAI